MSRFAQIVTTTALLVTSSAAPASAEFGIADGSMGFKDQLGIPSLQAGSHPFATDVEIEMNTTEIPKGERCEVSICELPEGAVEDITVDLPAGLAGDPLAVPRCSTAAFIEGKESKGENENFRNECPPNTTLGIAALRFSFEPAPKDGGFLHVPIYNLIPPPGKAARVGFLPLGVPVTIDLGLNPDPPYNVEAQANNIAQIALFSGSVQTVWGDPSSSAHDPFRDDCLDVTSASPADEPLSEGLCPVTASEPKAAITTPRSCTEPLKTTFAVKAWNVFSPPILSPGGTDAHTATTEAMVNCSKLVLEPRVSAAPTTDHAESPSGLTFNLEIDDEGLTNPSEEAAAQSDIKKAVVTLPEGVTINPSQAEGLAVCSEAQLARETVMSEFGEGCPAASKIGAVEVESQLLEGEILTGSLFVAEPYTNRFGSLIAIYQVIKSRDLGILVKLAGKVEPDPRTGQIVTTFDDLPQLPFSDFRLRFREGGRSPLVTPPACGTHTIKALFTPWANPATTVPVNSTFSINRGVGGGTCPPAGPSPFEPGFSAGTINNNAKSFSPFHMRLTRRDGDQDLTRFDATLPPGVVAKLAGVEKCSDAAIAQLKTKTGREELASSSCPASSKIGTVQAGAGVGSQLTYVPGSVYLAGPYGGAPLSVVGVVPAVAGPFDVGVVSTRQALTLDPVTAQPHVDGALSDPIPHILAGIPLRVRDIQVNVDRPQFTLNPTSCDPMAVGASIWGGALDVFSKNDDAPVTRSARFQAANCSLLGFKPKLSFHLKGGTKRGANPAFKAVLRPRPGDANLAKTVVRFPRATFLDQGHIRTVCTRVQFAADACPPGAIYGKVRAFTPLLDEPLQGPVYLRSSNNLLPDIVFDLKGVVDVEAAARADSIKGQLRVTFPAIPDAPVSRVIVEMQGGRKGLLVNSRDICAPAPRATVGLEGHNGKRYRLHPPMQAAGCSNAASQKKRIRRP